MANDSSDGAFHVRSDGDVRSDDLSSHVAAGRPAGAVRSPALQRVLRHMDAHLMEPLSVEQLAQIAGLGVMPFSTLFRREVGMPPYRYLSHLRITHAMSLLRQGMPLAMVAAETGFFDQPHMYRHFRRVCGITPGQYLAEHLGNGRGAAGVERVRRGLGSQVAMAGLPS